MIMFGALNIVRQSECIDATLSVSNLVRWREGTIFIWFVGVKALYIFGSLARRHYIYLVFWREGTVYIWVVGAKALYIFGSLTQRHYIYLVHWRKGTICIYLVRWLVGSGAMPTN